MNTLHSLAKKKFRAREKLYKIMLENGKDWKVTVWYKRATEDTFVQAWNKYQIDPSYMKDSFLESCWNLVELIQEERRANIEFKKIYKPYQEKFQELSKEYWKCKDQIKNN